VVLRRGFLGITMRNPDPYSAEPVIGTVAPGSAAEKAGLKPGDLVKEVDGKPLNNYSQLLHRLGAKYEGDTVTIKVEREKKEIPPLKVTLGAAVAAFGQSFLGILPIRDDPDPGVEVRYVYAKSPAEAAGLKAGDRIMKVGRPAAGGKPGPKPGPRPAPMTPITGGRNQLATLL
jgi:S1-C subfamily serine protease